jgi:hypothetical protein
VDMDCKTSLFMTLTPEPPPKENNIGELLFLKGPMSS